MLRIKYCEGLNMKIFIKSFVILLVIVVLLEIIFREMGFGNPPLYKVDDSFEYINIPNQKISTLTFNFETNEFSSRSASFDKNKKTILFIGDSVLNGGRYISNSDLVNNRLAKEFKDYNFLNISAGSWGPDNAYEYLKRYGNFNAEKIIMIFSSHDINDCIDHHTKIGSTQFPTEKYDLALIELFYKMKDKLVKNNDFEKEHGISKTDKDCEFNSGWQNIIEYSKSKNSELFVILHPEVSEIKNNSYNDKGLEIIKFLESNNINVIKELSQTAEENYRDNIHSNEKGHENLANIIKMNILK